MQRLVEEKYLKEKIKKGKQTFIQSIVVLVFSQFVIKILGLVYKLYLTNKEGFGDAGNAIYNSGFQIYALLVTISSIGVPNAISKLVSERYSVGDYKGAHKIFEVAFVFFAIIGFIMSCLLFFNATYISNQLLEIPEAKLTLIVLSPSIFFVSIISVLRGFFNGRQNMKPTANSQTIEQLAKTIFTIIIVETIFRCVTQTDVKTMIMATGANLATTAATIISFLYLIIIYKKYKKIIKEEIHDKKDINYNKITIRYIIKQIILVAMPMTISAIMGSINKNIDSFTIVRGLKNFLSEDIAKKQYGILSGKVDTLVTFPLSFNVAFATVLVPSISAAKSSNNMESGNKKILFSMLISILIGLPCTVGMIIFSKPILNLLFPNANEGTFLFQISAISIVIIMLSQTINGALQGLGKVMVPVISLSIGVVVKLIINLILVKINPETFILGGTVGAATGTIISHMISLIISATILKKTIKIKININKFIIKPIIATIIMGVTSYFFYKIILNISLNEKITTIISIIIAIITYIICVILLKIFDKKELKTIKISKN